MMLKNICYLNDNDDNIPPRSLMHFRLERRRVSIFVIFNTVHLPLQARISSQSVI